MATGVVRDERMDRWGSGKEELLVGSLNQKKVCHTS